MNGDGDPAPERVAETGSTNDDLLARVRAAADAGAATFAPCLLVADRQSAGRGRHGRRWHATADASLTFSIAWPAARSDLSGLSLAVGCALADALDRPGASLTIGLKWPNDLWLVDAARGAAADDAHRAKTPSARPEGRKLAGILIETAPLGAGRVAVVGIGINVRPHAVADAASGLASLAEIDGDATPAGTLARVAPALFAALRSFDAGGFAPFADRFAARDVLRGRRVAGGGARGDVEGVAAGLAADGSLRIETAAGTIAVASGEWRLARIAPAESPC
ncbi:MAG TPA: biotin--[acetyl-CoA-carboxylase] ligase [Caldimonas sp.]|nr:biotin--[acetyl-CoA-carboxylase] ligase [Caldimonas sp.]